MWGKEIIVLRTLDRSTVVSELSFSLFIAWPAKESWRTQKLTHHGGTEMGPRNTCALLPCILDLALVTIKGLVPKPDVRAEML